MCSDTLSIAVSARVLVNLESLNMAESVGNVTKHRKAPIVVGSEGGYRLVYVPVVSGMSLAHHYQVLLAREAARRGLPVTQMSLQGYFMKFAEDKIIKKYYPEVADEISKAKGDPCSCERIIVEACTVADIGGFLYTDGQVKRTSRFSFTYLMPTLDSVETGGVGVYPQLHVRYTPEAKEGEQALIYVENASALYTFTFVLEASEVSKLGVCRALGREDCDLGSEVRRERVEASIAALAAMIGNMYFGAKRSRSLPHWEVKSLIAIASKGLTPFIPSPGHSKEYLKKTIERLDIQKKMVKGMEGTVHYYTVEELPGTGEANAHGTPEEAIKAAASWLLEKLE